MGLTTQFLISSISHSDEALKNHSENFFEIESSGLKQFAVLYDSLNKVGDEEDKLFASQVKPLFRFISARWKKQPIDKNPTLEVSFGKGKSIIVMKEMAINSKPDCVDKEQQTIEMTKS